MSMRDLGRAIVDGACNQDAKDVAVEIAEVALDSVLDEGLLKELPGFGLVIACRKTWTAIHDRLFLQKVAGFLRASPKFSDAEKERFARENLNDASKAKKLGDTLVLILDKLDDLEKPAMLTTLFAAFVRGKIQLETFRRLAAAIDIAFVEDLKALANHPKQLPEITETYLPNLLRAGLSELREEPDRDAYLEGSYRYRPRISLLGSVFIGRMNENYEFKVRA